MKNGWCYIFLITLIGTIAGLLFGFDTGVISGALHFIEISFNIDPSSDFLKGLIVASLPFGALAGAIVSKFVSDHIGRKRSIILTAMLFIVGTLIVVTGLSISWVVVGRLVMGLGVGLSSMVVPMYLSEISPKSFRGLVVFCFQLAVTIGLFMAFVVNYMYAGTGEWQSMFAVGLIPAIILFIGMFFLPYSPRWLMLKGQKESALKVLTQLHGQENALKEVSDIQRALALVSESKQSIFARPVGKVAIFCFLLFGFQQASGINTIMYFAPTIYQYAGFQGSEGQILASIADGLFFIFSTILAALVVDRIGRRVLFYVGFLGMALCLALLGLSFNLGVGEESYPIISLCLVLSYIIFFGISLGPLCYLMMAELFPLQVRNKGMAFASCGNWGFNILVSFTFLALVHSISISYTFYLYAFITFIGLFFTYYFVPETKGIPLEKIEVNLYKGHQLKNLGQ